MARQHPGRSVASFTPRTHTLLDQIRQAASDSKNVAFGDHALDRMEERGISTLEALRVLRVGEIKGEIQAGKSRGEWKCKVVARRRGSREIGVITVVLQTGRLF